MEDPLELLQRSTELRRAHERSSPGNKYQRLLQPVGSTGHSAIQAQQKQPVFHSQTKTSGVKVQEHLNQQRLVLDRKQRSMAIGVGRAGNQDEFTASPLLLQ